MDSTIEVRPTRLSVEEFEALPMGDDYKGRSTWRAHDDEARLPGLRIPLATLFGD